MTIKQKNMFLVVGFIISLFVVYKLAFQKTLKLKYDYNTATLTNQESANMVKSMPHLLNRKIYLDSTLKNFDSVFKNPHIDLLNLVHKYCADNNLLTLNFLEPLEYKKDGVKISTYQFSIQGDFKSAIGLIYLIEQKYSFGEVVNVNFIRKLNYRTQKYLLNTEIKIKDAIAI